jgi:hypothetical protein
LSKLTEHEAHACFNKFNFIIKKKNKTEKKAGRKEKGRKAFSKPCLFSSNEKSFFF